jgi:hypothetical protein
VGSSEERYAARSQLGLLPQELPRTTWKWRRPVVALVRVAISGQRAILTMAPQSVSTSNSSRPNSRRLTVNEAVYRPMRASAEDQAEAITMDARPLLMIPRAHMRRAWNMPGLPCALAKRDAGSISLVGISSAAETIMV